MKTKLIRWAMALCLLLAAAVIVPGAAPEAKAWELPAEASATAPCTGDHTGWTPIGSVDDLLDACDAAGAAAGTAITLPAGSYYLTADVKASNIIQTDSAVDLCLNGHCLSVDYNDVSIYFVKCIGGTLNVCDCNASGNGKGNIQVVSATGALSSGTGTAPAEGTSGPSVVPLAAYGSTAVVNFFGGSVSDSYGRYGYVYVDQGGTLNMYSGASVKDNMTPNPGGVYVTGGGVFNMFGGEISGNSAPSGGGVYVGGATFNMYDGEISGNTAENTALATATNGGGGVRIGNAAGVFNMYGGEIKNNISKQHGGGVKLTANGATFNMEGGKITGNTANSTTTAGNSSCGGGVSIQASATFNMSGGEISGNKAGGTTSSGGGVDMNVSGATFNMYGGVIKSNTGAAGVRMGKTTTYFNMYDGEISNNNGGVLMGTGTGSSSTDYPAAAGVFRMYGGKIKNNTGNNKGGIFATRGSHQVYLYGGEITGNRSSSGGGGVYFLVAPSIFKIYDTTITGNTSSSASYPYSQVRFGSNPTSASAIKAYYYGGTIGEDGDASTFWFGGIKYPVFVNGTQAYYLTSSAGYDGNTPNLYSDAYVDYDAATTTLTVKDSTGGGPITVASDYRNLKVVLEDDWTTDTLSTVTAEQTLTIDLNGHTFTGDITNNGTLIIKDSSAGQVGTLNGTVTGSGTTLTYGGDTITLAGDNTIQKIGGEDAIVIGSTVYTLPSAAADDKTLDLNGYTLSAAELTSVTITGKLTIRDGSVGETGKTSQYRWRIPAGSELVLETGTITGNVGMAAAGAAVYCNGTFTMTGGAITGNRTTGRNPGGGVYLSGSSAVFNMSGGSITGNHADKEDDDTNNRNGGGVAVSGGATFNLSGTAEISGNTANNGNDVFVSESGSTLNMTGGVIGNGTNAQKLSFYSDGATPRAYISGGLINGRIQSTNASSGAVIQISGDAKVKGFTSGTCYGVTVTGGQFGTDAYNNHLTNYIGSGLVLAGSGDASYPYTVAAAADPLANMLLNDSLTLYMYVPTAAEYWPGGTPSTVTATVGGAAASASFETVGGYYKVTVPVTAKQMADEVVVTFKDAGGAFLRKASDSVKAYATRILADPTDAGEATLMTDMLNYGAAAQTYFNYNTSDLATDGVTLATASSVTLAETSGATTHPRAYHSANLTLEDRIDFSMYFWADRATEGSSYSYVVTDGVNGAQVTSGSGNFAALDDDGVLVEAKIAGLNLSAMENAVITVTFTDVVEGASQTASDSMGNYLYRNDGLAIDDAPAEYDQDGNEITAATGFNDSSDLYAKVLAFAHAAHTYVYGTQG